MWITQEKYLEAANNNYKEWFIDNDYDIIFIPLIARDYLTAYLMSFQRIGMTAPDIDWVLEKLNNYDERVVRLFTPLNIKFKGKVRSKEYYIDLLLNLKAYVEDNL